MTEPISIYDDSPDEGHQSILLAVRQAIADLQSTTGSADLLQMIVGFFQNNIDAAFAQLDDLNARLSELENPAPDEPAPVDHEPDPAGDGAPTDGS